MRRHTFSLFAFWLLLTASSIASALKITQLPALAGQPTITSPQDKVTRPYDESHALLISVSNYQYAAWDKLAYNESELDDVAKALQKQGFEVTRVHDPSGSDLDREIKKFLTTHGQVKNSRILFFYSGHGYLDEQTATTYLVPVDAMGAEAPRSNFFEKSYGMDNFKNHAANMRARHGLFIFDNCFSGMIFKGGQQLTKPMDRGTTAEKRWRVLKYGAEFPVRHYISAGGPDQKVSVKSTFARAIAQGLSEGGPLFEDGYVTGKELGYWVTYQVAERMQVPVSAALGEVLGDMIFQKPTDVFSSALPCEASGAKISCNLSVFFDFDKSTVQLQSKERLDAAIQELKQMNPEVIVAVGHGEPTDGGSLEYQRRLSTRRAEAVKAYLVSKGIERNRIYTLGTAGKQPVGDGSPAGKAGNRRVEIEIVGVKG